MHVFCGDGQILGIDIGATSVKYARLTKKGSLEERQAQPIASSDNLTLYAQLASIVNAPQFELCDKIGIGSPGPLDVESGVIVSSANMPCIKDLRLVEMLQEQFPQKSIRLDNDANCATLGEKYFGLGRGLQNFAVLTLGTGVGGGCIFADKLQRGYKGNFFEVGHIPIFGEAFPPRRCGCGNAGCMETYASATGVAATYRERAAVSLNSAAIAERARAGDNQAQDAYRLAARALGIAAASITQLMNLTDFIFTGGMAAAEDLLRPELEKTYRAHVLAIFRDKAVFSFTCGDEDAGIFGAAALFLE